MTHKCNLKKITFKGLRRPSVDQNLILNMTLAQQEPIITSQKGNGIGDARLK